MSTAPLPLYQPPTDLARYEVLYEFACLGYTGRVYLTFISALAGADLLATLLGDPLQADEGDDDEEEELMLLEDFLLSAASDPRNKGFLSPLLVEGSADEVAGVAMTLYTKEGHTRTLTDADVRDHVVGIRILGCVPLTEDELAELGEE
jgi:hypothetical protein